MITVHMEPSADAATLRPWKNRRVYVIVGVTGGIAAYKTVQLVRLLVLDGHEVHVIPTDDAVRFVGIPTWEAISRHPVTTSVHDDVAKVRHVALGQAADLVIVAPATANFLAKMAAGLADDLLGTSLLATTAPVVVAPAMHTEMWRHPATVHNVEVLRSRGVHVIGPEDGPLTGGDVGPGRMTEPDRHPRVRHGAARRTATTSPGCACWSPRAAPASRSTRCATSATARAAGRGSRSRSPPPTAERDVTLVAAHADADVLAAARAHPRIEVAHAGTAAELAAEVARTRRDRRRSS